MRTNAIVALVLVCSASHAAPAWAQRYRFERVFEVTERSTVDVSTNRGRIEVSVGEPGRIVVSGQVTVRTGWNLPQDAIDIARRVAAAPPIEGDGNTIRLRPPSSAEERRSVTVNYQVRVPPETHVTTVSDSGATSVRDVAGPVSIRTQSSAIELTRLGGAATVTTGSGAVTVDGIAGALTVTTNSSAFTGRLLRSGLRLRTQSGAVDATFTGNGGDVDVQTGSSAIRLQGVRGALTASSQSGHVSADGVPTGPWEFSTGSGRMDIAIASNAFTVNASSDSGSVSLAGTAVQGSTSKRKVTGTIGGGGPLVRATSRSGSIGVRVVQ